MGIYKNFEDIKVELRTMTHKKEHYLAQYKKARIERKELKQENDKFKVNLITMKEFFIATKEKKMDIDLDEWIEFIDEFIVNK